MTVTVTEHKKDNYNLDIIITKSMKIKINLIRTYNIPSTLS